MIFQINFQKHNWSFRVTSSTNFGMSSSIQIQIKQGNFLKQGQPKIPKTINKLFHTEVMKVSYYFLIYKAQAMIQYGTLKVYVQTYRKMCQS